MHVRFRTIIPVVLLAVRAAVAAPASDGSIYHESFPVLNGQTIQHHPLSHSIGVGADPAGGAVRFLTSESTEGVFRAGTDGGYSTSIDIAPYSEFVATFDFHADGPTGGGFELFRPIGEWAPYEAGILVRAFAGSQPNTFSLQVDHAGSPVAGGSFAIGTTHQFAIHRKANLAREFDVWVNGGLFGTFVDRAPSVEYQFIQWGDSTGGGIYSDAWVDTIRIGSLVEPPIPSTANPEPAALGLLAVACLLAGRRSRRRP